MQEPVQETVQESMQEPGKRKSLFNIVVAVIIAAVLLIAAGVAYGIFNNSYNANLDKLKAMVADTQAKYTSGSAGATLAGQAQFYMELAGAVTNETQILGKLNGRYPLLLGRASEQSLGLAELRAKLDEMSPQLDVLKACVGEDESITASLAGILTKGATAGQTAEYAQLVASNDALAANLAGISFEGPLEEGRAGLAATVTRRAAVLAYLVDDAAINEELAKLSADAGTSPADLKTAYAGLLEKNDALTAEAQGVDLTGYGSGQVDIPGMIAARKALISAYVGYMGELASLQPDVAAFCAGLDGAAAAPGKLSVKLASYMVWVKQLKDLRAKLDTVNAKEAYAPITAKRTIDTLGMSAAGQTLLGYEKGLNAVSAALTSSKDIEKKITALIAEKKMDLPDKISAIEKLVGRNNAILASISVEVPDDLKPGLESFAAACQERVKFFNEFMGYVEDQQIAALCSATAGTYARQRKDDLNNAAYWEKIPGNEETVKYYKERAAEKSILISEQSKLRSAALKNAGTHKKAYEASRKKYTPLLDK